MVESRSKVKSFSISKRVVLEAWEAVKANHGGAGVDGQSIEDFERDLSGNLYKIWNRLSSGTYVPPPVKEVQIPKQHGLGVRSLGVPTVADRVAQTVVKLYLEPNVEKVFHEDSYGYRPGRSALDAVGVCRERCWRFDWLIDVDYQSFFDSLDHSLVLRAVAHHTDQRWVLLYVDRWLKAPVQREDGTVVARDRGTPQGSAISPVLANVFLHYAFDAWMAREFPAVPFERYADDVVAHCKSKRQAQFVLGAITTRMVSLGLELNPGKTRIVYCKDSSRNGSHEHERFDFLGYTFRPRCARNRRGKLFTSFAPAISDDAAKNTPHDQTTEAAPMERNIAHGDGAKDQLDRARMGQLLRAFPPEQVGRHAQTHRRVPGALGHAEVQTTVGPPQADMGVPGRRGNTRTRALCPVAQALAKEM